MSTASTNSSLYTLDARTKRRNAAEKRFRLYGMAAVAFGVLALVVLLSSVLGTGLSAFRQTFLTTEITLDEKALDKSGTRDPEVMAKVTTIGYAKVLQNALVDELTAKGLLPEGMKAKDVGGMISKEAPAQLRDRVLANPDLIGQTITMNVLANGRIDGYFKGRVTMESAALDSNVSPEQLQLAEAMRDAGMLDLKFNWGFIFGPDASELRPEAAGLGVAIIGSAYMMLIVLALALPIGVAASIYLEEFAPQIASPT